MVHTLLLVLALGQTGAPADDPLADTPAAPQRDSRAIEALLGHRSVFELPAWGHLEHGQHPVGFEQRAGLSTWYPSRTGAPMVLGDYASQAQFQSLGVDANALLSIPMFASLDAEPLAGPFPLVVIPGGYLNAGMVAETAEFLASHGFVVVFFLVPDESIGAALDHATRMLASISHTAADTDAIALWGYQRGGLTATLLQGASRARALVSIEGSEGWKHPDYGYPAARRLLKRLNHRAPVIRFQSNRQRPAWYFSSPANLDLRHYDSYPQPVETVTIDGVSHDQLGAFAVWSRLVPGLMKPSPGALAAHHTIGHRALAFLQQHLGSDPGNSSQSADF